MQRSAEILGSSIVVVGAFNPAIFSVDWLEKQNLLGKQDAEGARHADNYLVTKEVATVETEWFVLQVLKDRLTINSKASLHPGIVDLVVGVLCLLAHTPVNAVGLNFSAHYRMESVDDYHRVGDLAAPKEVWHQFFPSDSHAIGLMNLTLRINRGSRDEMRTGGDCINLTLQPSARIHAGVAFSYNDHHEVGEQENGKFSKAEFAASIVEQEWKPSYENALRLFSETLDRLLAK